MSVRIDPTVGRIVWFYGVRDLGWGDHTDVRDKPRAAIVVDVLGNDHVNLGVFDRFGTSHPMPSVRLLQDGETRSVTETYWAEWMPYQKGMAAKQADGQAAKVEAQSAGQSLDERMKVEAQKQRTIYDERAKVEAQRPSPPAPAPHRTPAPPAEEADLSSNETRAPRPKPLTPEALKGLSD